MGLGFRVRVRVRVGVGVRVRLTSRSMLSVRFHRCGLPAASVAPCSMRLSAAARSADRADCLSTLG